MTDLQLHILSSVLGIAGVGGIIAFLLRHWLKSYIDSAFEIHLSREKAELDVEKASAMAFRGKELDIYPQVGTLLYQMRNQMRDSIGAIRTHHAPVASEALGELVIRYTNQLYAFRIFFDDKTFDMLHAAKRAAQDAYLLMNRYTRRNSNRLLGHHQEDPDDPVFHLETQDMLQELDGYYSVVDAGYQQAIPRIRQHLEGCMKRMD